MKTAIFKRVSVKVSFGWLAYVPRRVGIRPNGCARPAKGGRIAPELGRCRRRLPAVTGS
jgi:hypothetical protein